MTDRMAKIVHMGKLGGFVALLDGRILEMDGQMLWRSAAMVLDAARRNGLAVSDLVVDTHSVAGSVQIVPAPVMGSVLARPPAPMSTLARAGYFLAA